MHPAEATGVHAAAEMSTAAKATMSSAAEAAVSSAAETATMAAAPTSTSGENGRSDRQRRSHGRRDDAGEKPAVHLNILLVAATVAPLQGNR
jgi:hypothetical protein